jgi:hypothetical protein
MEPLSPAEAGFYINSFKERIDKHGKEMDEGFLKVFDILKEIQKGQEDIRLNQSNERLETFKKIQEVKDSVYAVEKAASEKNYKLSLKVVSLSAAIGMIGGGAGSEIKSRLLDKPTPQIQQERTVIEYKSTTPLQPKENEGN